MSKEDESIEAAKTAWRSQDVEAPQLSIDYLQNRMLEHRTQRRNRTVLEYLLGVAAASLCAWFAVAIDSVLFRVGALVMLVGVLYSLYEWWHRKAVWSTTVEGSATDGLTFYKNELARLRDLHRDLWKVYLPAAVPGAILLLVWILIERPEVGVGSKIVLAIAVGFWITVSVRHESREADRYQRELDALEGKE
jgi:hypothetical protein